MTPDLEQKIKILERFDKEFGGLRRFKHDWKDDIYGKLEQFISEVIKEVTKNEREKIRNKVVELATQGKYDRDEEKGILFYVRLLQYLDSLSKNL